MCSCPWVEKPEGYSEPQPQAACESGIMQPTLVAENSILFNDFYSCQYSGVFFGVFSCLSELYEYKAKIHIVVVLV